MGKSAGEKLPTPVVVPEPRHPEFAIDALSFRKTGSEGEARAGG